MTTTNRKPTGELQTARPTTVPDNTRSDWELRDDLVPHLGRRFRAGRETWVVHCRRNGKAKKVTLGVPVR